MKLQIDTINETIKIAETVTFNDLINNLTVLFPNDRWKGFKLEPSVLEVWTNPIVINPNPYVPPIIPDPYPYPGITPYPSYPWITCDGAGDYNLNQGIYNVQC